MLRPPDVEMTMKADIAHQFWHGKINLMAALARRQIIAKGPIPKILKLLPAVEIWLSLQLAPPFEDFARYVLTTFPELVPLAVSPGGRVGA